jgi:hypothetical protein
VKASIGNPGTSVPWQLGFILATDFKERIERIVGYAEEGIVDQSISDQFIL